MDINKKTEYAPILIPTLCRANHFIQLVESLKKNSWAKYTELYIAVDYHSNEKYQKGRNEICKYLKTDDLSIFKGINIILREKNFGAFGNIDALQNDIADKYDKFISIPDDMIVSPNFIEYMNKCLNKYEDDEQVVAVCGYNWPVEWDVSEGATCFKQNMTCTVWGIGYWSEKYKQARKCVESGEMLRKLPEVIKEKKYFNMIDVCKLEYINAACYRWCYGHEWLLNLSDIGLRAYLAVYGKMAIAPVISKCRNYGFDGSGEFCQASDSTHEKKFSMQQIDTSKNFHLIENTKNSLDNNRKRLNQLDSRSDNMMRKTNRLIWICEHLGIFEAKLYCLLGLPYDFLIRAYNKYIKIQ